MIRCTSKQCVYTQVYIGHTCIFGFSGFEVHFDVLQSLLHAVAKCVVTPISLKQALCSFTTGFNRQTEQHFGKI